MLFKFPYKKEYNIVRPYYAKYKAAFISGVILSLIAAAISAIVPYIYGRITDRAIFQASDYRTIAIFLSAWLVLVLVRDSFSRRSGYTISKYVMYVYVNLLHDLVNQIMNLPMQFHKDRKMGQLSRRIYRGMDELNNLSENVLRQVLPQFFSLIISFAFLFYVRWELATILLIIVVAYVVITILKVRDLIKTQEKMWSGWEGAFHILWDALGNVQTVKSSSAEEYESGRKRKAFLKAVKFDLQWIKQWWNMSAWQQTIYSIGFVVLFGVGVALLTVKNITPGELIMFVGYTSLISGPLFNLAQTYRQILNGLVYIKKTLMLFKVMPEKEYAGSRNFDIKGDVIFQDVKFAYKSGKEVLRGITFTATAGQTVALVGRSGVGKTTSMDLLSRYYFPKEGKISIDGHNIKKFTLKSLRSQIALLPQEVVLFHDTIMENIRYGRRDASDKEVMEAAKLANAHDFIMQFTKKYDSVVGERGVKLSVGQKDRVGIARAILRNPKILILDEPTSNLDAHSELAVQEALQKLMHGRTTFIIAHRLSTIAHADKILVFEAGKIVEEGTHEELMAKSGAYRKLHDVQFGNAKKSENVI